MIYDIPYVDWDGLVYYDGKVKRYIAEEIAACWRDGGSCLFEELPDPNRDNVNFVYRVTDKFISDHHFEVVGKQYSEYTFVKVTEVTDDIFNFIVLFQDSTDLADYYTKSETEELVDKKVAAATGVDLSDYYTTQQTDAKIKDAVEQLDVEDGDIDNQYVAAVGQIDGKIQVLHKEFPKFETAGAADAVKNELKDDLALKADLETVNSMYQNSEIDTKFEEVYKYIDDSERNTTYIVRHDSLAHKIILEGSDGSTSEIDTSTFVIGKMIESISFDSKTNDLIITFNSTDGQETTTVSLDSLVDAYTGSSSDTTDVVVDGHTISVAVKKSIVEKVESAIQSTENIKTVQDVLDAAAASDSDTTYTLSYDSTNHKILLVDSNNNTQEIDATEFVTGNMIESVELDADNNLVITFNTTQGLETKTIPIGSLIPVYTGTESSTVTLIVGADNTLTANIKEDAINFKHLDSDLKTKIEEDKDTTYELTYDSDTSTLTLADSSGETQTVSLENLVDKGEQISSVVLDASNNLVITIVCADGSSRDVTTNLSSLSINYEGESSNTVAITVNNNKISANIQNNSVTESHLASEVISKLNSIGTVNSAIQDLQDQIDGMYTSEEVDALIPEVPTYVGSEGEVVNVTVDNTVISATINEKSIEKSFLTETVQTSLDNADQAKEQVSQLTLETATIKQTVSAFNTFTGSDGKLYRFAFALQEGKPTLVYELVTDGEE